LLDDARTVVHAHQHVESVYSGHDAEEPYEAAVAKTEIRDLYLEHTLSREIESPGMQDCELRRLLKPRDTFDFIEQVHVVRPYRIGDGHVDTADTGD
jgi:hypothetical protein